MKRSMLWLLGMTLALTACASETHLPYRSWRLSFSNPPHMEMWVEDANIADVTGRVFHGYNVGRDVIGAALPKQIYVRWQSLVEPQTYQATLDIPDSVRKLMLTKGPPSPRFTHAVPSDYYYSSLTLRLAPGGWIKVWLSATLDKAIPVMCVKATVVPQGPGFGKMKGHYAKLSAQTQTYLAHHPIPYASWDCNKH